MTFYPETEFRRSIDVGVCSGQCGDSMMCKAVWTRSKAIATPNGDRCIPVIVNCSCVKPYCYREANFQGFPEQYTNADGNTAIRTKVVDIGKCVNKGRCPLKGSKNLPWILLETCKGRTFKNHSFLSSGGRLVNISAIATCFCSA